MTASPSSLPTHDELLLAATRALEATYGGRWSLSEPVDLGGSHRSVVLRVSVAGPEGSPRSLVLKAHGPAAAVETYAVEAAALRVVEGAPRLLACDDPLQLLVLEDLGSPATLADLLLGDDAAAAERGMLDWAAALARCAAVGADREPAYADELLRRLGRDAPRRDQVWLPEAFTGFGDVVERHGLLPAGARLAALEAERDDVLALLTPTVDRALGLSDACPDNVLLADGGPRFLDFEAAAYRSVYLDAVYTRVPFATCWCVFARPHRLAERMEQTYRSTVSAALPAATEDEAWETGMARADAAFAVAMTAWLLDSAVETGRPVGPAGRPSPSRRALLAHRWLGFGADDRVARRFPVLAETFGALHKAFAPQWPDAVPLPPYPAFAGAGE